VDPIREAVHIVHLGEITLLEASRSACHWVVSRVMTEADSPAAEPNSSVNAGTKSELDSPCRYNSGSTSATFGYA
jgi:hypothetical protein